MEAVAGGHVPFPEGIVSRARDDVGVGDGYACDVRSVAPWKT